MLREINFLHINASDIRWGASIESFRLHQALLESGYASHTLCALKEHSGNDSSSILPGKFGYLPNALFGKFFNAFGLQSFGYPSSFFLRRSKLVNDWNDIIILRNLHWWYISIGILPFLSQKAPLIWRLPDMWAVTGHCAYSYECEKWETGCGKCPRLYDYPELFFDTTHFLWLRKQKIYQRLKDKLVFVSPSKWLKEIVEKSPLTCDFRCELIPTAVNLSVFKPGLTESARSIFGIGKSEKVIMLSSFKLNDQRKGARESWEVIKNLKEKVNFPLTVLVVGYRGEEFTKIAGVKIIKVGFTQDEKILAACYNAADVYLSLSKADNLPNTLVEASACGIPIVTLDSGGCREALVEGKSGYVVSNSKEAEEALRNILSNSQKQKEFSEEAREFALSNFSMEAQVKAYVVLATDLISKHQQVGLVANNNSDTYRYLSGVRIDNTTYQDTVNRIVKLSKRKSGSFVCIENAYVLTLAARDDYFKKIVNSSELATCDGMALVWALKLLGLKDAQKVSGPDLTPLICKKAEQLNLKVGFYGATPKVLKLMANNLKLKFPGLDIAYLFSPPFRLMNEAEDKDVISKIIDSGINILFIGIGCPKQEIWAFEHKDKIPAVIITVGAAFDFIAGALLRAPKWMQAFGLEWLFRLSQEPRRLWKRYVVSNTLFIYLLARQLIRERWTTEDGRGMMENGRRKKEDGE